VHLNEDTEDEIKPGEISTVDGEFLTKKEVDDSQAESTQYE